MPSQQQEVQLDFFLPQVDNLVLAKSCDSAPKCNYILTLSIGPPYLMFSYYTGSYNFIQQSRLDGTERTTITFGGRPRALSFDFRLDGGVTDQPNVLSEL